MLITGEFSVDLDPIEPYTNGIDGVKIRRMSLDKTFRGELSATSQGEMLSAMTPTKGSAGYVAIEQVSGMLSGKKGSFVLQHFGVMASGTDRLILEIIPDSGQLELEGISGKMTIKMEEGKHFYEFDYELPYHTE